MKTTDPTLGSPAIGQPAPGFTLPDLEGVSHALADQRGRIAVIHFWSAECQWCKRTDPALLELAHTWGEPVTLLVVASNANESQELLKEIAARRGLSPVLVDSGQRVADLYGAVTTPHVFIVDHEGILRYQGAFDDVTFRQRTPTRIFVQEAVAALLAGRPPEPAQTPPYGCSLVRFAID